MPVACPIRDSLRNSNRFCVQRVHAKWWQARCSPARQQAAVNAHRPLKSNEAKTFAPEGQKAFGTEEVYAAVDVQRAGAAPGEK
jgi:hypothetical protein